MKKILALALAALMAAFACAAYAESVHTDEEVLELARAEVELSRKVAFYPAAFEGDFQDFYVAFHNMAKKLRSPGVTAADYDAVMALKSKREALVQIVDDPETTVWEIWGENMASEPMPTEGWDVSYDSEGFRPFLNPYLIFDQQNVKGNVIIIAGGSNTHRTNVVEGYPVAEFFNENGYNAFVLQRRVLPYADIDCVLDLARAIRFIRHNAQALGIGNADTIITCGFSAGGGNIMTAIALQYGHVTPDAIYPDYVCDEVDAESADMTIAIPIYGARVNDYDYSVNPNIPAIFAAAGQQDPNYGPAAGETLSFLLSLNTDLCFFLAPDAVHGVGLGTGTPNYIDGYLLMSDWRGLALDFLDTRLGYAPKVRSM